MTVTDDCEKSTRWEEILRDEPSYGNIKRQESFTE